MDIWQDFVRTLIKVAGVASILGILLLIFSAYRIGADLMHEYQMTSRQLRVAARMGDDKIRTRLRIISRRRSAAYLIVIGYFILFTWASYWLNKK